MSKPRFLGWEEPPEPQIPTGSWAERLTIQSKRPGEWAKYGPYANYGSAMTVIQDVHEIAERHGFSISADANERRDGKGTDIFIRVSPPKEDT